MNEEIFGLIHEGLNSRDFDTRHSAKIFADSLKRTTRILKVEKAKHIKDDGKQYLKQLVFMTKYLMQNPQLNIEERMHRINSKLKELEVHQLHQLMALEHWKRHKAKSLRKGKKAKTVKAGKNKARKGKKAKPAGKKKKRKKR